MKTSISNERANMPTEFGSGKTILIFAIVFGCFAVLWPIVFYPMLQSSLSVKPIISNTPGNLLVFVINSFGSLMPT